VEGSPSSPPEGVVGAAVAGSVGSEPERQAARLPATVSAATSSNSTILVRRAMLAFLSLIDPGQHTRAGPLCHTLSQAANRPAVATV